MEDKDLFLKDISARIKYHLKCQVTFKDSDGWKIEDMYLTGIFDDGQGYFTSETGSIYSHDYKPYLRPLSSITDEEKKECCDIFNDVMYKFEVNKYGDIESLKPTVERECIYYEVEKMTEWIDWLISHDFDYRGLIDKNLALEK